MGKGDSSCPFCFLQATMKAIHEDKSSSKSKTGSEPSNSISAAKKKNEWFYRTRFEESGEDTWLQEYGRYPSAWRSPWFRQVVRRSVTAFLHWCYGRRVSLGRTARWLTEYGPSPSKGKAWRKSTLRYLLDRSPDSVKDMAIKKVMRRLKVLGWAQRNQQPSLDHIIELSESTEERARRVWEMHRLLLPPFRRLSAHLVSRQRDHERVADRFSRKGTGMERRAEFGLQFLGTKSLPSKTLRDILQEAKSSANKFPPWVKELEQLERAVPQFLDFQPTKFAMKIVGQHKNSEALLRILCRFEGISTRTARRYKQTVQ